MHWYVVVLNGKEEKIQTIDPLAMTKEISITLGAPLFAARLISSSVCKRQSTLMNMKANAKEKRKKGTSCSSAVLFSE